MDLYNIWLSAVLGSNLKNGKEISELEADSRQLYEDRHRWHKYGVFTKNQMEKAIGISLENINSIAELHYKNDIKSVSCFDENFPDCFKNIPQSPVVLFYKGDLSLLCRENKLGVVGSRHPDRDSLKIADDISFAAASKDIVIISGLAQGVDTIAHKAALRAEGKTVAFIGTPLDKYYPSPHRPIQEEISRKGCVVSEYYCSQKTFQGFFLERNRLIAAASKAVCVVQAKKNSGTISTARRAIEYSKDVFSAPGVMTNPAYEGSNKLIKDGAYILTDVQDILDYFDIQNTQNENKTKINPLIQQLSDVERQIYDTIGTQAKSSYQINAELRMSLTRLNIILSTMEIKGVVKSVGPNVYVQK